MVAGTAVFLTTRSSSKPVTAKIQATESDFHVTLGATSVPAGHIRLTIHNEGQLTHELVAFRTDLPETALPMTEDGARVNEDGPGITHIDPEAENIGPGHSKTVTLNLAAGRYVLICNLPSHYTMGMHDVLTVH